MYYQTKCAIKPSHLSYADDVIIFTNCKEDGLARLIQFLNRYETMSGQRINYAKSAFIPGKKASLIAQRIKAITGFTMKTLLLPIWVPPSTKGFSPSISKLFDTDSSIWKRMCTIRTEVQANIFWSLGDGNVSFWHDWWLPEGTLANLVGAQTNLHIPVNWFWHEHEWDRQKLQQAVPQHIINLIMEVPINIYQSDYLHWRLSKNSAFTTKSAWNEIRDQQPVQQFYKSLWSKLIIPNISVFAWRLIHNWIPVDERLKEKGITLASKCLCCEDTKLSLIFFFTTPTPLKLGDSLHLNSRRNNGFGSCKRRPLLHQLTPHTHPAESSAAKSNYCVLEKTARGWYKLTDGASKGNPGISGAGGILRDQLGKVIFAFQEPLGNATNTQAELSAIYRGLQICFSRGLRKIWIETDATAIIKIISAPQRGAWNLQATLQNICKILNQMEHKLSHIFREGNQVADFLANQACYNQQLCIFNEENIPVDVGGLNLRGWEMFKLLLRENCFYVLEAGSADLFSAAVWGLFWGGW
ncbi:UNVERIFIED_CONTAM: putative ribonuclease H protein [Sesamum radiatum]|uniref:Ribonuclease H protein n=1 Tax=Sesamum radiatum TaxID=300843 RepID=A0AAW2IYK8_SESRA